MDQRLSVPVNGVEPAVIDVAAASSSEVVARGTDVTKRLHGGAVRGKQGGRELAVVGVGDVQFQVEVKDLARAGDLDGRSGHAGHPTRATTVINGFVPTA